MRSKIMVLTGAGISVSCGIPDFRSSGGIYARLKREYPQLSRPEDMFDFDVFKSDPRPFYSFAKDIFPGQFRPSITHQFIRSLERRSKLLQNYTQNIDTLERVAGISKVCYCHGMCFVLLFHIDLLCWLLTLKLGYFRVFCDSFVYGLPTIVFRRGYSEGNNVPTYPLLPALQSRNRIKGYFRNI